MRPGKIGRAGRHKMQDDGLYESVLDGIFENFPSLPGLVLTARMVNGRRKKEDTPENALQTIADMTQMLCSLDLALLEKKHRENVGDLPRPPTPRRRAPALERADAQVAELEADKRVRTANAQLRDAMEESRKLLSSERDAAAGLLPARGAEFGGFGEPSPLHSGLNWLGNSLLEDDGLMSLLRASGLETGFPPLWAQDPLERSATVDAPPPPGPPAPPAETAEAAQAEDPKAEEPKADGDMPARPSRLRRSTRAFPAVSE
jgi:hypothetical protein